MGDVITCAIDLVDILKRLLAAKFAREKLQSWVFRNFVFTPPVSTAKNGVLKKIPKSLLAAEFTKENHSRSDV